MLDVASRWPDCGGIAIRFELAEGQDGGIAFGYSPLLESVLSLHVLAEPKHHSLQHGWVRAMRQLSPHLRRELVALSFLYRHTLPNFLLPTAVSGYDSFDVELGRFLRLRRTSRPSSSCGRSTTTAAAQRPPRRRILSSPDVRAVALKRAGMLGPQSRRAAALLFDDPAQLVERFASFLEAYWEEAFAAEWNRIEPQLADSVELAGRQIAGDGMFAFLLSLAPQLRIDPGGRSFGLDVPHDHRVQIDAREPAAPRPERLRVAARPDQLRRAVAADGDLPSAAAAEGARTMRRRRSSSGC